MVEPLSSLKTTLQPDIGPNSIIAVAFVGIEVSGIWVGVQTGVGSIIVVVVDPESHHHQHAVSHATRTAVAHLFFSKKIPSREETELEIRDWAGAAKKLLVDFPILIKR